MYWYVHMRSTWHLLLGTDTGYQVVEGNLVVNKGELQYYDYSIAVSSTSLLALMHVPNLVAALVCASMVCSAHLWNIICRY
jgi:hypothetical protein